MDDESSQNALLKNFTEKKHNILETTKQLSDILHKLKENIHETFNDTKLWIRNTMTFSSDILTHSLSVMEESKNNVMSLKELMDVHIDFIKVELLDNSSKNIGKSLLEDAKEFMSLLEWLMMHVTNVSSNCLQLFRINKQIELNIPNFFGKIEDSMDLLEHVNYTIEQYLPYFIKTNLEKNEIFNRALDELQCTVQNVQDSIKKHKLKSTTFQEIQVIIAEALIEHFCFVKKYMPQPDQLAQEYTYYKILHSPQELQTNNSLNEFKTKTNEFFKEELNQYLEKIDFIQTSITETMQKLDDAGAEAIGEFQIIFEEEVDKSNSIEEKLKQSLQKTEICEDLLKKFEELMDLKDLQQHFHH